MEATREQTAARGHPRKGGAGHGQCPGSGHSEGHVGRQTRIKTSAQFQSAMPEKARSPPLTGRPSESKLAMQLRPCLSFSTGRLRTPTCGPSGGPRGFAGEAQLGLAGAARWWSVSSTVLAALTLRKVKRQMNPTQTQTLPSATTVHGP